MQNWLNNSEPATSQQSIVAQSDFSESHMPHLYMCMSCLTSILLYLIYYTRKCIGFLLRVLPRQQDYTTARTHARTHTPTCNTFIPFITFAGCGREGAKSTCPVSKEHGKDRHSFPLEASLLYWCRCPVLKLERVGVMSVIDVTTRIE